LTEPEAGEDWAAVADAVQARSRELNMSTAELARQTGLSETTIRYLGTARRNKSCLVSISAVLRWRFDHLTNILNGQPEKNVHVRPPALANLERITREEIAPIRQELASLTETVRKTTALLDAINNTQRQPQPPPQRQGTA
jgi:prefoldin subunit 5